MTGPPDHLSAAASAVWAAVVETFEFGPADLIVLRLALEAYDRAQQARAIIERDGLTTPAARGGVRAHPAISIERDARRACASLLAQLRLEPAVVMP